MQPEHPRAPHATSRVCTLSLLCAAALAFGCAQKQQPAKAQACDQGSYCRDSDCDTICDHEEGDATIDTDHDGTPDYLDLDSDNDTVSDRVEAGDDDPRTPAFDRNLDGIPDYQEAGYPYPLGSGQNAADGGGDGNVGAAADATVDAAIVQGSGSYGTTTDDKVAADLCPATSIVPALCQASESNLCDGLDNDCDGHVDGSVLCTCERGQVRNCFLGPPGRRGVGACEDGEQTCMGTEFTYWSDCKGGRSPSPELCDGLDNDCNGCTDELAGCVATLSCPGPGDARTPDAAPFAPYMLDASRFYTGKEATGYHWAIRGSPCDRLFGGVDPSATSESGTLSYQLTQADAAQAAVTFTLSGAYEITLTITTKDGPVHCTWIVHVRAPGVRVELCWDKTGPSARARGDAVDLDLHLGKPNATSAWSTTDDCYWDTCRGDTAPWGYAHTTTLGSCTGQGAQNFPAYSVLGFCPNPRLDADNRLDSHSASTYITENINLDDPQPGDHFRVMVHYNTNLITDAQTTDPQVPMPIAVRPLVNVYCSGELAGTFGGDPETAADPERVTGFDTPGQMWRVVDVSSAANGCSLTPLAMPAPATGYWLSPWDPAYGK